MDVSTIKVFHERIERIVESTNDMHLLNEIRQSLAKADEELRKEYANDRYFNDVLMQHHTLQRLVQRKLRLAIIDGQNRGMVKTRTNNRALYSAKEFSGNTGEYMLMGALGKLSDEQFESFLRKGREHGDLSIGASLRILGIAEDPGRKKAEILRMARQPGATKSEIAVRLGMSKSYVSRVLKHAGLEVPMGDTKTNVNRSLDAAKVIEESLNMLDDMLPVLATVDTEQLNKEQAARFGTDLSISIGKLRKLARTLKRIEEVNGTGTGTTS